MWLLLLLLLFFSSAVSPVQRETLALLRWHLCVLQAWRVVLLLEWTIHELNVEYVEHLLGLRVGGLQDE